MLFCAPNVVLLFDLQLSIAMHFASSSVKSELENNDKVEF